MEVKKCKSNISGRKRYEGGLQVLLINVHSIALQRDHDCKRTCLTGFGFNPAFGQAINTGATPITAALQNISNCRLLTTRRIRRTAKIIPAAIIVG
jgi:hypothetical protein